MQPAEPEALQWDRLPIQPKEQACRKYGILTTTIVILLLGCLGVLQAGACVLWLSCCLLLSCLNLTPHLLQMFGRATLHIWVAATTRWHGMRTPTTRP